MGCAVADSVSLNTGRLAGWLDRTNGDFTYLTHVGAGWALARVPFRRRAILRSLDPIHSWLAFDGLGFHDTYFHHPRILDGWRRVRRGYEPSAYDQGVGRALWFVGGADIGWCARTIDTRFAAGRRGHLWAGLGLALAYAGCADKAAIQRARLLAGDFFPDLAQGAAFAAAAHEQAGPSPPHTALALEVLTGLSASHVAATVAQARAALPSAESQDRPVYELWRAAVRSALIAARTAA